MPHPPNATAQQAHVAMALAHAGPTPPTPSDLWHHGWAPPGVVVPLVVAGVVYYRGMRRLRRTVGADRVVTRGRALAFAAGVGALLLALGTPLDAAGEVLFSAHMVQHLVLVLVAAPLLVLGAPERVALWAFPLAARRRLGSWGHAVAGVLGPLLRPGPAVAVTTASLWLWHVPVLYDLAIEHEGLHVVEHMAFVLTALLFWWTLLRIRTARADRDNGGRLLALFAMVLQGSLLGALITFAAAPLYDAHRLTPRAWGVEPLVDQQLAGLIMWVPPASLYLGVAGWLLLRLLGSAEEGRAASAPSAHGGRELSDRPAAAQGGRRRPS